MKRTVTEEKIEYYVEYSATAESKGKKNKRPLERIDLNELSRLRGED